MKDIFLADAHLTAPADRNYRCLLEFLRSQQGRIRTLFLLGDIFEFWIGYRHAVFAPYVPLLEGLRQIRAAGTEIVYVEGNHDFHLGPYFASTLGCRILPDGGTVELDGERVYIAHGDLIDPEDKGYRLLRRLLRSRPLRWLAAVIPPDWAWGIARWSSTLSRRGHSAKNRRRIPEQLLEKHADKHFRDGCQAVVTAHFHHPLYRTTAEGKTLIALGDWIDQYSYAVFEDGGFSLRAFSAAD